MLSVPNILPAAALILAPAASPALQQRILPRAPSSAPVAYPAPPYADYADLLDAAPLVADAVIRSTVRLKGPEAAGLGAGMARLYVEADVLALIRGPAAVSARLGYTLDVALDPGGRLPKYRKARVLLFARPVRGNAGQIQLVRRDAQRGWTPGGDALARRITRALLAPDAPPVVTGIGNAFHTAGDLPGEGETQIFLTTKDGRPVSLNVLRRPDQPRRWSVALSEVVDETALPPARDTLLWYRLACALPPDLPADLAAGDDPAAVRDDYQFVLRSLGRCQRTAPP